VLDEQGTVLDDRLYSAWGEDMVTPTRTSANPYGFAGTRQDPTTGLCYNRARVYDPRLGRFNSSDPIGIIARPNLFLYAGNNPITSSDPSGFLEIDLSSENLNTSKEILIGAGQGVAKAVWGFASFLSSAATLPGRMMLNPIGTIRDQLKSAAETIGHLYEGAKSFAADPIGSGRGFNARYRNLSDREFASVIFEQGAGMAIGESLAAGFAGMEGKSLRPAGKFVARGEALVAEESGVGERFKRLKTAAAEIKNANQFTLDGYDRTIRARSSRIIGYHEGYEKADIRHLDRPHMLLGDHRGHLVPEGQVLNPRSVNVQVNVVAEAGSVNLGPKKVFENLLSRTAESDPNALFRSVHEPHYPTFSRRPDHIVHSILEDDKLIHQVNLLNQ
jgi:RHS repeat-associated protein